MTAVGFSVGMGVDSIAAMHALLQMSEADRGFSIDDLVCVTAQTGAEYPATRVFMERYALPTMRHFGVRYVQIARGGPRKEDGYVVLSDSRRPQRMHMNGPYTLTDEYIATGTGPQYSNRRCSQNVKGQPQDLWYADNLGTGYVHMLGYSAEEGYRILRDKEYTTNGRIPRYPLAEMGWDRETSLGYLHEVYGVIWARSCCVFCPFQINATKGVGELVQRWRADPAAAGQALIVEDRALAFNGNSTLFKGMTGRSIVEEHGMAEALAAAEAILEETRLALYDIRRIRFAAAGGRKGPVWRSVRTLVTGSRAAMRSQLYERADDAGVRVTIDEHDIARAWITRPEPVLRPAVERQLTIGPAGVHDKERDSFIRRWAELTGEALTPAA
jgi:hypothetical protein